MGISWLFPVKWSIAQPLRNGNEGTKEGVQPVKAMLTPTLAEKMAI
jgi:hypothetical protein